jgi:hypothetical protein
MLQPNANGSDAAEPRRRVNQIAIASPDCHCRFEEWTQMVDEGLGSGDTLEKTEDNGFVEVMFAKSLNEATGCHSLLQERQIPARVEVDSAVAKRCGIAVLVPADRLIEASELLASRALDQGEDFDEYEDEDDEELDDDFDDDDYDDDDYEDEELDDDELDDDFEEEEGEE